MRHCIYFCYYFQSADCKIILMELRVSSHQFHTGASSDAVSHSIRKIRMSRMCLEKCNRAALEFRLPTWKHASILMHRRLYIFKHVQLPFEATYVHASVLREFQCAYVCLWPCVCVLVKRSCEPQRDPALSHLSYSQSVNISVSNSVNSPHTQKLLYGCV